MKGKRLLPLLLLYVLGANGQTPIYPVISLPVVRYGETLSNPWTGGFDAPEFSAADINRDGIKDLFVFDRSGNKVMVFLNDGSHSDTAFHYAPQYEQIFPPMNTWALLRDYNNDGIPDIFTNQTGGDTLPNGTVIPSGIEVYKGSIPYGNIRFDLNQPVLYYQYNQYNIDLWINSLAPPAILDVNHDGALDILDFGVYGSTVVYYQNTTASLGLPPDSLKFEQASQCWGEFYVSSYTSGPTLPVTLDVSCKTGTAFGQDPEDLRHSGAAFWPISDGADSNVNGILTSVHIGAAVFLGNTGSDTGAYMGWQDTLWPSCNTQVSMPLFPAAYQIDGDNDGLEDILMVPNFPYPNAALNFNNVWFYKRVMNDTCEYQFAGDSFLVHTMLDFGTSSKPVFFDYNYDSLMDLVVGNLFYYNPLVPGVSQLALYRNTGTRTKPVFTEVTTDYMGLSSYQLLNISPTFGDMDGDGKPDMIIGDANGDIDFFKNVGDTAASFPTMTMPSYFNINGGANATPFIYDVNGDSLPDLVIGNEYGLLAYYWNFGTRTQPEFSVDSADTMFGNINVTLPGAAAGNSQPYIMRDSAGNMLLFVGTDQGLVYEYLIDTAHLRNGTFTQLSSNFLQHTVGSQAAMQAFDLNNDGKMEYITGCSRGGLQLFSETVWDSSVILSNKNFAEPINKGIQVFPNPASDNFTCVVEGAGSFMQPQLYTLLGAKVVAPYAINTNNIVFDSRGLANGMYIVRIVAGDKILSAKIIVAHR